MCGRFTLTYPDGHLLAAALGVDVDELQEWSPRFNIAPTQEHFIVVLRGEDRRLIRARWGLLNEWSTDASGAARTINARAETLSERPAFREAFERRRCIVPADGFYEWQGARGDRRPSWFHRQDGGVLFFAGLYEYWRPRPGVRECTFTIATTDANDTMAQFHHRMPVILDDAEADEWMFAKTPRERLEALLRPTRTELRVRAVSQAVNRVENEGPWLIEPAAEQVRLL